MLIKMTNHKGTILYVEDNPEMRDSITGLLEDKDFFLISCGDGTEAYDNINDNLKYDLLLMDASLPRGLPPEDLIRFSKNKNPKTPILVFSGYDLDIPGVNATLPKGIRLETLVQKIVSLISHNK